MGLGGQNVTREEHTFAWIQNLTPTSESLTRTHLAKYGFDQELNFIPYSTRAAWCAKYPNAVPYVECVDVVNSAAAAVVEGGGGGGGVSTVVRGYPLWSHNARSVTDIPREVVEAAAYHGATSSIVVEDNVEIAAAMAAAAGGGGGGGDEEEDDGTKKRPREEKLLPKGILSNAERSELHAEIYNYFAWLRQQVKAEGGKKSKSVGGMSSDGLKELLRSMGEALPSAKSSGVSTSSSSGGGGGGGNKDQPPPFLEEALFAKLKHRVDSGIGSTSKRQKKEKKVRKEKGPVVSWEERLKQLTEFGEEHGHFEVPPPLDEEDDDDVRFYNWVQKINYELRGECETIHCLDVCMCVFGLVVAASSLSPLAHMNPRTHSLSLSLSLCLSFVIKLSI